MWESRGKRQESRGKIQESRGKTWLLTGRNEKKMREFKMDINGLFTWEKHRSISLVSSFSPLVVPNITA
jgi:hypothetical protein